MDIDILGVYFDENVTFKQHIKNLCGKLCSVVGMLSYVKFMLPTSALLQIYFAHFHSHLYYATQLWGLLSNTEIDKLQTLQNRALKQVFNLATSTHTDVLFTKYAPKILPIRGIIFHAIVCFVHRMVHGLTHSNMNMKLQQNNPRSNASLKVDFNLSTVSYGERKISKFGANMFNSLPSTLRVNSNKESFKRNVKIKL